MKKRFLAFPMLFCLVATGAISANKNKNRAAAASQRAAKDGQIKKERQRLNQYSPHQGANSPAKKGKEKKAE